MCFMSKTTAIKLFVITFEVKVLHMNTQEFYILTTIPDKRVGTRSKFSPPCTFTVDNQVIFSLFAGKKPYFPTGRRDERGEMGDM